MQELSESDIYWLCYRGLKFDGLVRRKRWVPLILARAW